MRKLIAPAFKVEPFAGGCRVLVELQTGERMFCDLSPVRAEELRAALNALTFSDAPDEVPAP